MLNGRRTWSLTHDHDGQNTIEIRKDCKKLYQCSQGWSSSSKSCRASKHWTWKARQLTTPTAASPGANELVITRPDDWHLHLRDGPSLDAVVEYSARVFHRAIIMPNLVPPVVSTSQVCLVSYLSFPMNNHQSPVHIDSEKQWMNHYRLWNTRVEFNMHWIATAT